MTKRKTETTYEAALKELQEIVSQLQAESIGMDDLTEKINRAAELLAYCQGKLRETESKLKGLFDQ